MNVWVAADVWGATGVRHLELKDNLIVAKESQSNREAEGGARQEDST